MGITVTASRSRSARHRAVATAGALLGGLVLVMSACAPAEPEQPTVIDPADAQSIEPPAGVELTDEQCLVGGWTVRGDELDVYVDSFQPGEAIEVSGELAFGFTLERYHVAPQVGVVWQSRGTETLSSLVGEAVGSYQLDGASLELVEERDDIELVDVADGERSRVADLFLYSVSENPLLGATVVCAGDTLTLTSAPDADGADVSVTLERTR